MANSKIKTAEVNGISFEYDESALDDMRVILAIGKLQDETLEGEESIKWYTRLMDLLFPDSYAVMNEVAKKNKGVCSQKAYEEFFASALEAMQAKN